MSLYNEFAQVYAKGDYPTLSQAVAEILPALLKQYKMPTTGKLLDVACGEGSSCSHHVKGWLASHWH